MRTSPMPARRRPGRAVTAAIAAMLILTPIRAGAATDAGADAEGFGKLLTYAGCALAVFKAFDPMTAAQASMGCLKIFYDELERLNP
jgi:hypothetical protein